MILFLIVSSFAESAPVLTQEDLNEFITGQEAEKPTGFFGRLGRAIRRKFRKPQSLPNFSVQGGIHAFIVRLEKTVILEDKLEAPLTSDKRQDIRRIAKKIHVAKDFKRLAKLAKAERLPLYVATFIEELLGHENEIEELRERLKQVFKAHGVHVTDILFVNPS